MKITSITTNIFKLHKAQNPFAQRFSLPKMYNAPVKDTFEKRQDVSFVGKSCSTNNFEVKFLYDIDCPSCAKPMVTSNQMNSFIKNIDHKTGENLIKVIKRYDKYYHDTEKAVADEICEYAVENPQANISQIVKELSIQHQENLIKEQNEILAKLKAESKTLEKSEREQYEELIDKAINASKNFDEQNYFKRKTFLSDLSELGSNLKDEKNFERIYSIAQNLPTSSNSINAFFIKYSRRGEEEIARRLLNPSLTTTEHVHPRAKDGENNTSNYIAMCAECNSNRGHMPYLDWFKEHPEMPENLQKYVNTVAERIKSKELRGYNSYLYEIIKTIEKETDGKLKLEMPDMNTIVISDTDMELGKIRAKKPKKSYYEKLAKIIEGKKTTLEELKNIAAQFKRDEEFLTLKKYYSVTDEIDILVAKKRQISSELELAKKEQRINDNKLKNLKNAKEQLENTTDRKELGNLKNKIKNLETKVLPQEIPAAKVSALDEDYKKISAELEEKRNHLTNILSNLTLEDEYNQREDELLAKLEERNKIRQKIYVLSKEIQDKDSVLERKREIEEELSNKTVVDDVYMGKNDATQDLEILKKYELLTKKAQIIDDIDPKDFCSNLKPIKNLKYSFILQEAKASIEKQLEELDEYSIVITKKQEAKFKALEKERKECNTRIKAIAKIEKNIKELQTQLDSLNLIQDEKELNERLDLIRTRRNNLKEKIKYLNIDERISDAIKTIGELEIEYGKKS